MNRCFVLLLGILLLSNFVVAVSDSPSVGAFGIDDEDSIGEDVVKLQEGVEKYSPIDDSGEIDFDNYKPFVTKAENRVAEINTWLDENISWMRYIFHMKPEISFLFLINVVVIWFFLVLFLNADGLWFFIDKKNGQRVFGFGVFFILLVIRFYYGLANVLHDWIFYILTVFLPTGFLTFIGGCVLMLFLFIFFLPFAKSIVKALRSFWVARETAKEKMRTLANNEAMEALISEAGAEN